MHPYTGCKNRNINGIIKKARLSFRRSGLWYYLILIISARSPLFNEKYNTYYNTGYGGCRGYYC